ncbi:hypothetical protein ECE07_14790 [Acinetobacter pittii]|nr:hypothetical protein [Acinetobacter pittii]
MQLKNQQSALQYIHISIPEILLGHIKSKNSWQDYDKEWRANSNMRCDSLKSLMIINKLSKFL